MSQSRTRSGLAWRNQGDEEDKSSEIIGPDSYQPIIKALMNPIVLRKIFGFLALPDLKSGRLVCKTWNDEGGALHTLGKRSYLNLKKTWPGCCFPSSRPPPKFNPYLAKRIKVSGNCSCAKDAGITVSKNFRKSVTPISALVEELVLHVDCEFFVKLPLTLVNLTNLKCLSVLLLDIENPYCAMNYPTVQLPSLTSFQLNFDSRVRRWRFNSQGVIYPVQQLIIDAAPNLVEVKLRVGFYPRIKSCSKIKTVEYDCEPIDSDDETDIDVPEVGKVLEPIKNSVEDLTLWVMNVAVRDENGEWVDPNEVEEGMEQNYNYDEYGRYKFPQLSNLTSLKLHSYSAHRIQGFLRPDVCPKLKHLSVLIDDLAGYDGRTGTFGNYRMDIESLDLKYLTFSEKLELQDITDMVNLFPVVKKFKLELMAFNPNGHGDLDHDDEGRKIHLKNVMKAFQGWDLDQAHVVVTFVETMNVVEAVLSGMSEWKGQKTVTFHHSASFFMDDTNSKIRMRDADAFLPGNKFWVEFYSFSQPRWKYYGQHERRRDAKDIKLEEDIKAFAVANVFPAF